MDREQAKKQINQQEPTFLTKAKVTGYICPYCGQGKTHGQGITRSANNRLLWHCVNEKKERSILGLYAGYRGIEDTPEHLPEILREAAQYYGIPLEENTSYRKPENQNHNKTERNIHTATYTQQQDDTEEQDFTEYYKACRKRLKDTDYPQKRGLSLAVLERFNVGYDPAWKHPKVVARGQNPPATPRLIIPTSPSSYIARDTRQEIPEGQKQFSKSKAGSVHLFNLDALETGLPCIVVEGEIDALSIIEAGGNALALGSTAYTDKLLSVLEGRRPKHPIILALDNDPLREDGSPGAGAEATDKLASGLDRLGIPYYRRNLYGEYKDANEALQKDRKSLLSAVAAVNQIEHEEAKAAYLRTSSAGYLESFIDGIAASVDTPCISTGFSKLDGTLDGGFYEGLYIMGAISSLGKTSLALQICDQIAKAGQDVLIISLEMARAELMAKSISRTTLQIALRDGIDTRNAKTLRGITDGKRYVNYNRTEKDLIYSSINAYREYAGRIFISEGVGDIGVAQIRETIEKHIRLTGNKPFVLIDYLQIVAPYSERATDKQNTDHSVRELKRISRDFKLPVMVISSLNRDNYQTAINMAAYKESGSIEYSADCLIGLQLKGAGDKNFDATAEKKRDPRTIELVILKQRNAAVGNTVTMKYYPKFNYFEEC